jgi:hypothetical protein
MKECLIKLRGFTKWCEAGEEVTLVISKRGKDFVYFLQLQTRWW